MRYYATCLNETGNELSLVARADSKEEATQYLMEKYNIQKVVRLETTPPHVTQPKSYYAKSMGVHEAVASPRRTSGRGASA